MTIRKTHFPLPWCACLHLEGYRRYHQHDYDEYTYICAQAAEDEVEFLMNASKNILNK